MRWISLYVLGKWDKITGAEISPELYWDDPELTWKGGGVDTAGITAAAAAAAAAAALAGSCWTAIGLMMCSTAWILPSSIILAGGAAWNMEYWALIAGMATRRDQRHQVCWERVSWASSQRAHSPPSWLCQLSRAAFIRTGSPMCQWGMWGTSTLPAGQSTTNDVRSCAWWWAWCCLLCPVLVPLSWVSQGQNPALDLHSPFWPPPSSLWWRAWPRFRDGWEHLLPWWGPCSSCWDWGTCGYFRKEKWSLYCRTCRQQLAQPISCPLANPVKYQLIYYCTFPRTNLAKYILSHLSGTASIWLMALKKKLLLRKCSSCQNWTMQNN